MRKITKIEVGIAIVLALIIVAFSTFYNFVPRSNNVVSLAGDTYSLSSPLSSEPAKPVERVQVMDADILGELEKGTFETVVPSIEALTRERCGFIVTERLTFKNGLWSGEIISKLPSENASAFTMSVRQVIDENGEVVHIQIDISEFYSSQDRSGSVQYSTIEVHLNEVVEGSKAFEPVSQLMSALPILVTGLVWVSGGLIIGVPLCFISLGVVMLIKRVIIPLWKKELVKPT